MGRLDASVVGGGVWFLVVPPVFKTGEPEYLGLAGSIPVRLRQLFFWAYSIFGICAY